LNKLFWLGLIICVLPISVQAEEEIRYYDVEIILFENLDRSARDSEYWPSSVELVRDDKTVSLGERFTGTLPEGVDPALAFKLLPAKSLQLTKQAEKIEASDSRRVLLHTAWRQPGLSEEDAMTVYFKKMIPGVPPGASGTQATGAANTTATPQSPYVTPEAGEIEALIRVYLSRYLHVTTDIIFVPQPANQSADPLMFETSTPDVQQPVTYRQHQTRRRMRSRELHYLDNPVLGLLIFITPYENQTNTGKSAPKN